MSRKYNMDATQPETQGVKPDPEQNGGSPAQPPARDGDQLEITIKSQVEPMHW